MREQKQEIQEGWQTNAARYLCNFSCSCSQFSIHPSSFAYFHYRYSRILLTFHSVSTSRHQWTALSACKCELNTVLFDATSSGNLHHQKPESLRLILLPTVHGQLCLFPNSFVWKPEHANSLDAKPKTDFNTKWPFKVIHFNVTEKPLRDYILQYIIMALYVKVRKI